MSASSLKLSEIPAFSIGSYKVQPSSLEIIYGHQSVRLEPRVMQVLVYLAGHAGDVISRAELEQVVWEGRVVGEDALTNTISKLRKVFADSARDPQIIETLPKTGYRLIADVNWTANDANLPKEKQAGLVKYGGSRHLNMIWLLLSPLLVGLAWLMYSNLATDSQAKETPASFTGIKPSVAILPFENLGTKPEQDYFAHGIAANLITDLSKVKELIVIAPGSVFSYRNSPANTQVISQELRADYVIRGSVQRQGDAVRVNVQLFQAEQQRALWGERFESGMQNLFHLQDNIATALINALHIELDSEVYQDDGHFSMLSVQAYDLFLKGLEEYGHRTPEGNLSARSYFQQAIELDKQFARAIAGMALVHSRDAIDGWTSSPLESLLLAEKYANQAKSINPTIPQVHFVMAQVALFKGDHLAARLAAQRAIHHSPNYADAYALLAWIMNYANQPEEAIKFLDKAILLNPVIPASYSQLLGEIEILRGNHAEAIQAFERALLINPAHMRARMWLIATLVEMQMRDEAEWQVTELLMTTPDFRLSKLEYTFPFKDQSFRKRLLLNLEIAGLPD